MARGEPLVTDGMWMIIIALSAFTAGVLWGVYLAL